MKLRSISRSLAVALMLPVLAGCVALGSFEQRAQTFNRSVADTQNTGLLLNLVRASRTEPLYFTSTSGVHGSGSEDLSLTIGGATHPLDSNTSSSFDTDVLGSKDFYSGMMTPLGPADVNLLFSQGYSREMVLYLVVDRLKVTDVSALQPGQDDSLAPTSIYFNDPRSPTFVTFKGFVDQGMLHGLTTEVTDPPAAAPAPPPAPTKDALGNLNIIVSVAQAAGGEYGPVARLCYDLALATPAAKLDFTPESPRCGAVAPAQATPAKSGPAAIAVKIGDKKYEIVVYTRSIFGIFKYLGGLIGRDETGAVQLHHYPELVSEQTFDGQLLTVLHSGGDCFAHVGYRGAEYCVPNQGAENTKDIFNILDALIALKTSPGDLPATPTVRLTP